MLGFWYIHGIDQTLHQATYVAMIRWVAACDAYTPWDYKRHLRRNRGPLSMVKILMVDDEPDAETLLRQNVRREIRKGLYEILFAQSGDHALELLDRTQIPDVLVVLSDINMPGMTGLDLLDRIKSTWPDLPMIMITAYGDKVTEDNARQRGAATLLAKPVDFSLLRQQLSEMAEEHAR
jgi:two-component system, response regulator, stage 0 sporulation protein F